MFCRSCGAPVGDTAKFCPRCGTQILKAAQPVQQPARQPAQQPQSAADRFRQSYQQGKQAGQNLFGGNTAARQTGAAGKAAKKAAKAGGKSLMGMALKTAAVGTIGIAVVGGASTILEGGGGNPPPADPPGYVQDYRGENGGYYTNPTGSTSENTGGYTGEGYASAQEGTSFTHFVMQYMAGPDGSGEPYTRNDTYIIERDPDSRKAYLWQGKREGEPDVIWDYDPATGTLTSEADEDMGALRLTLNPDGSLVGGAVYEEDGIRSGVYVKFTGLRTEDMQNWQVSTTGETFTWEQLDYQSMIEGSRTDTLFYGEGMAWLNANGVDPTLKFEEEEETQSYTPVQRPPSTPSVSEIPSETLQYWILSEGQKYVNEYVTGAKPHKIMQIPQNPDVTQKEFNELVRQKAIELQPPLRSDAGFDAWFAGAV